jgi:hypothetical protein
MMYFKRYGTSVAERCFYSVGIIQNGANLKFLCTGGIYYVIYMALLIS